MTGCRYIGPVLLLLLLAACGIGAASEFSAVTHDSAGVRIVENRGLSALGETWRVDAEPMREFGVGGAEPVYRVTGAVRLSDGRVAVASSGQNAVRLFAADGRPERTLGRAGDGPGEFRTLFWIGVLPGDSIAAWDVANGRLAVFTPAGDLARSVAPRQPLGIFPMPQGVLPDGRLVVAAGAGVHGVRLDGRVQRDTQAYVVLESDGAVRDTIGRFPGTEMIAVGRPGAGMLTRPLPFGLKTGAAVQNGKLYVATGERYEVAAFAPGGALRERIRAPVRRLPVTPEDIRDYRRGLVMLGGEGNARLATQERQLLDQAPYPGQMAAVVSLQGDEEGNVWVQEAQKPSDRRGTLWTVIGPDGRARARVRTPAGLNIHQIGRDWILGVALDDSEVEHVRLHRLRRAGSK
jgi:hypothetical protein